MALHGRQHHKSCKTKVETCGSSESKSRACTEGNMVNVGDLSRPSRMKYLLTSLKARKQKSRELFLWERSQMGA